MPTKAVLGFGKFAIRATILLFVLEYFCHDFLLNGVETTAELFGKGLGDFLWALFSTIVGHMNPFH